MSSGQVTVIWNEVYFLNLPGQRVHPGLEVKKPSSDRPRQALTGPDRPRQAPTGPDRPRQAPTGSISISISISIHPVAIQFTMLYHGCTMVVPWLYLLHAHLQWWVQRDNLGKGITFPGFSPPIRDHINGQLSDRTYGEPS